VNCSVLQCIAVSYRALQCVAVVQYDKVLLIDYRSLQCGAVCCSVLQCVAVCCSVTRFS